jgi:hypothetical protein
VLLAENPAKARFATRAFKITTLEGKGSNLAAGAFVISRNFPFSHMMRWECDEL